MIVLIDAFNLIYKFSELEEHMARGELEAAMDGLLVRLKRLKTAYDAPGTSNSRPDPGARSQKRKDRQRQLILHVFFDGKRRRGDESKRLKYAGMDLYYSHDLSADHLIMEFIKRNAAPGDLLVVSTDKKVREFARIHRCRRQSSEEFAEWMEARIADGAQDEDDSDAAIDAVESGEDLAYWEQIFGAAGDK